jgi:hypothetical protein
MADLISAVRGKSMGQMNPPGTVKASVAPLPRQRPGACPILFGRLSADASLQFVIVMTIRVSPQRPSVFLGQPFPLEVAIADVASPLDRVTAQVVGSVHANKPAVANCIQSLLHRATPYVHVQSAVHDLGSAISADTSFLLTISASDIPQSFEGAGLAIRYDLLVQAHRGEATAARQTFPIIFIGPAKYQARLEPAAIADFRLTSIPSPTSYNRLSLHSPFDSRPAGHNRYVVHGDERVLATLKMPIVVAAGGQLSALISLEDELDAAEAKIAMREAYRDQAGTIEFSEIASKKVDLKGFAARRFELSVPFTAVADFETEVVEVTYVLEVTFSAKDEAWRYVEPISIGPPEFSITKSRVVRE